MQGYIARDNLGRTSSVASPSRMLEPGCATEIKRSESATHKLEASWSEVIGSGRKQTSNQDDLALVERLQAGDHEALEAIIDLYSPKLYKVAQRILGESADTEEVIQDVFWTVFRKAKTFQGNSRFSTWLYRLTVNEAFAKIRRRKNQKREIEYEEYLPKFTDDGHHRSRPVVDWSDTLDRSYVEREIQRVVKAALDGLKPLDRSIVVLSDLEGMSDKEIAATLQLTVSAVKTRLHRARLFLRGRLANYLGHSAE
jgi:RNA polymerase sigma-70 factor, ECF subfamily